MKTKIVIIGIGLLISLSMYSQTLIKTEHGWKGKYIEATRMRNSQTGQLSIAFKEVNWQAKLDNPDIEKVFEKNKGFILVGDAFGLEMVIFDNMNTKAQQDSVIKKVLPQLELWYCKH